ncbi:metal ABC transporter ATP-binding protein [Allofustis seminis]|uniref:metal ABC transporter ATP-binding protein n=1 Tax=Allofustis seminis TaxID=166939 RepID=UPI00036A087B|nr:metal ABC transporter ATP-binding protein [Allofustis seminis]
MGKDTVTISNLTMAYQKENVLEDINMTIPNNCKMAIIGPNGAGKSTLLKGILELYPTITGEVSFFDKPYQEVYKRIAYVPQEGEVQWNFPTTVEDVVLMGRYVYSGFLSRYSKEDKKAAKDALEKVKMLEFRNRQISELSGGQRQRVFLARAIAQDADLYFLDEPLKGVDINTEHLIMDILNDFQSKGRTIVAVHHDLSTVRDNFDYVAIMNKTLRHYGPTEKAFTKEAINAVYQSKVGDIYGY